MAKKYYWLKLQKDFFKRHDIRIVESMPNGKDYILFYLKLLVESISHEGALRFNDTIPYNEEMLATITNTNVDIVRAAMGIFKQLELIEVLDDSTIFMAETQKMLGCETEWAEKKRDYRKRTMSLSCPHNVRQEIELDKEIDKEIEIELEHKPKTLRFQPPTLEEVQSYIIEKGYNVNAEHWFNYYQANGWKVGRNSMKDWKASIRYWATKDNEKPKAKSQGINWDEV